MDEINPNLQQGFSFGGWLPKIIPELEGLFGNPYKNSTNSLHTEEFFMFQAFLAGMENASVSNPNPSVGCVIVKNNKIIASGCTSIWKGIHAEREAFNKLQGENLQGSDIYVTLEPCTHFGNQPPCIDLFYNRGINKIVIARPDSNPAVANKGIGILRKMGIKVKIGIFAKEVTAWNYPFFIQQKFNRPLIALKWTSEINGSLMGNEPKIMEKQEPYGPLSLKYILWLRQKYDSVLMDGLSLLEKGAYFDALDIQDNQAKVSLNIIFDPKASICFCSKDKQMVLKKIFFTKNIKTLLLIDENMIREVLSSSSKWCIELKASANIKILPLKRKVNFYSAEDVLEGLQNPELFQFFGRPLQSIFVEEDPRMLRMFIQHELFDVAHVFRSALKSTYRINMAKRWQLITQACFGNDILMEMAPDSRFQDIFC